MLTPTETKQKFFVHAGGHHMKNAVISKYRCPVCNRRLEQRGDIHRCADCLSEWSAEYLSGWCDGFGYAARLANPLSLIEDPNAHKCVDEQMR